MVSTPTLAVRRHTDGDHGEQVTGLRFFEQYLSPGSYPFTDGPGTCLTARSRSSRTIVGGAPARIRPRLGYVGVEDKVRVQRQADGLAVGILPACAPNDSTPGRWRPRPGSPPGPR